jgi:hypothetical protein
VKDALLVPWSANFNDRINTMPGTYQLTAAQASAYTPKHTLFSTRYETLMQNRAEGTNSESLTILKNQARTDLLGYARELYALIQANNLVPDSDKVLAGVHVREGKPTPIPPPTLRPGLDLVSVVMRTLTLRIYDADSRTKRGKPFGATSAFVYSYVGANYPSDPSLWNFNGASTRYKYELVVPDNVAAGAQVWVCAAWVNARGEAGPVSTPITTNVQGGGTVVPAAGIKIAA